MYTYAFSQLFVGLFVDRFSGVRVMAWGGLLLVVGSILSALAPSLWMLYAARIMVGMGSASVYLSITKETNRIFPGNFALMLGFVMVLGYLGGVAGNAPFIAIDVDPGRDRFGCSLCRISFDEGFSSDACCCPECPLRLSSFSGCVEKAT